MRLICPNCDAQYEVPPEVMPQEGRDVQCSNCGQTWFQHHPDFPADDDASNTPQTDVETDASPASVPSSETAGEDETPSVLAVDPTPQEPVSPNVQSIPETTPQRRELDPSIADVLRAEAEMESRARRKDAVSVESQPDLGLPEKTKQSSSPSSMTYPLPTLDQDNEFESEPPEFLAETSNPTGAPRDLFPDIEEINSTLRSNTDRSPEDDAGQTAQIEEHEKRNSRLGFSVTVAVAAALALAYVFAPQLVDAVPQAEDAVTSYVEAVDKGRGWLDAQITAALSWLDNAAASGTE